MSYDDDRIRMVNDAYFDREGYRAGEAFARQARHIPGNLGREPRTAIKVSKEAYVSGHRQAILDGLERATGGRVEEIRTDADGDYEVVLVVIGDPRIADPASRSLPPVVVTPGSTYPPPRSLTADGLAIRRDRRNVARGLYDGRLIPLRVKLICLLGAVLVWQLLEALRHPTGRWVLAAGVVGALALKCGPRSVTRWRESVALKEMARADAERQAAEEDRRVAAEARATAVKLGFWWAEEDGSMSIGPVNIKDLDDLDRLREDR